MTAGRNASFVSGRARRRHVAVFLLVAVWLGFAVPLSGQGGSVTAASADADTTRTTIVGFVRDSLTLGPLEGAVVLAVDEDRGVLSDSTGRFVLEQVPRGRVLVSLRQYGYEERLLLLTITDDRTRPWEFKLHPSPAVLEGLEVIAENLATMEQRLVRRRSAAPFAVRVFDQERLLRSAAPDAFDFVMSEGFLRRNPCPPGSASEWCIMRRGRLMEVQVFIDERPAFGGLDELIGYPAHEFHLIEIYSGGLQVRAYTHAFMDRMARSPMILLPLGAYLR